MKRSRPFWPSALAIGAAFVSCDSSEPGAGGDDAGSVDVLAPQDGADSGVSDAGADGASDGAAPDAELPAPVLQLDPTKTLNAVSPLLFGEGMEWTHYGQDVMLPDPSGATSGTFRPEIVTALQALGIPVMRYPGGTLSDLFHWSQAIGPMASRTPQPDQTPSADGGLPTLPPNFGPDEYAAFAAKIGAALHLTVNVGTSDAASAASWLSYYKAKGVAVKYVEVGNEAYLGGPGNAYPAMPPADYASKFDAYASALRAVDPNVSIMAIGCTIPNWSITAMGAITQKADYVAVHVGYFPFDVANTAGVDSIDLYWAMMGGTKMMRDALTALETVVAGASKDVNKTARLAMTEHASLFYPGGADVATRLRQVQRNQTLAAAVFSASSYQTMMRDPKVGYANHINPLSPLWQAPLTVAAPGAGYPAAYAPRPVRSAFGHAYALYRAAAGGDVVLTQTANVPTFDTPAGGVVTAQQGIDALDPLAVKMPDGKLYVYVVNRHLTADMPAQIFLPDGAGVAALEQVAAPAYDARNDADHPDVVTLQTLTPPAPFAIGATRRVVVTFPAHSITRLTLTP